MNITIRHLKQINAIHRQGSFARAATELNISQPALSRSIASLEKVLSVKLFNRSKIKNQPTAFCRHLIEKGWPLVEEMSILERDILLIKNMELGKLSIGAGPFGSKMLLGSVLSKFCSNFPDINVSTFIGPATEVMGKLDAYNLDIAFVDLRIVNQPALANKMDISPLNVHQCYFFCRREHPLLKHKKIKLKDILNYPLSTVWLPDFIFLKIVQKAKLPDTWISKIKNRAIQCEDWDILFKIIATGNSIGLSALPIIMDSRFSHRFVTLPPTFEGCHTNLGILVKKNMAYSPAMKQFHKYLIEEDQILFKKKNTQPQM